MSSIYYQFAILENELLKINKENNINESKQELKQFIHKKYDYIIYNSIKYSLEIKSFKFELSLFQLESLESLFHCKNLIKLTIMIEDDYPNTETNDKFWSLFQLFFEKIATLKKLTIFVSFGNFPSFCNILNSVKYNQSIVSLSIYSSSIELIAEERDLTTHEYNCLKEAFENKPNLISIKLDKIEIKVINPISYWFSSNNQINKITLKKVFTDIDSFERIFLNVYNIKKLVVNQFNTIDNILNIIINKAIKLETISIIDKNQDFCKDLYKIILLQNIKCFSYLGKINYNNELRSDLEKVISAISLNTKMIKETFSFCPFFDTNEQQLNQQIKVELDQFISEQLELNEIIYAKNLDDPLFRIALSIKNLQSHYFLNQKTSINHMKEAKEKIIYFYKNNIFYINDLCPHKYLKYVLNQIFPNDITSLIMHDTPWCLVTDENIQKLIYYQLLDFYYEQ
jgi:hypothetical protein